MRHLWVFVAVLLLASVAYILLRAQPKAIAVRPADDHPPRPDTREAEAAKSEWAASGRPDIVLILIDALRADHVGYWGYARNTTPYIDRLAAEGLVFKGAHSQETYTQASVPSFLGSIYPFQHGVLNDHPRMDTLPDEITTLPEVLHDNGYTTAAFVYNPHLNKAFNFDQGFDVYDDAPEGFAGSTETEKYETAAKIRAKVSGWLQSNLSKRPFFLYLHYRDVHGPYLPPKPYDTMFGNHSGVESAESYDGEIAYTDSQLRLLTAELAKSSNDTVYIIMADHGEGFGEHGYRAHGWSLYEELLRVPLIFYSPQRRTHLVVQQPVELIDVAPTILDIANITPPEGFMGRSLLGALDDGIRFRGYIVAGGSKGRLALIRDGIKYYVHPNLTKNQLMTHGDFAMEWSEEMYNLSSDPHERDNIISSNPGLASEFRQLAEATVAQTGNYTRQDVGLDDKAVDELRALGYVN